MLTLASLLEFFLYIRVVNSHSYECRNTYSLQLEKSNLAAL